MNTAYARAQLQQTCQQLGALYTWDEAEGEIRACIQYDQHWWQLIQDCDEDDSLWYLKLQQLRESQLI